VRHDRRDRSDDTITVLPNGVDLDYFTPTGDDRATNAVVFSGKLSYHANETAVAHLLTSVMPAVWARRPEVKLWLVGKDPSSDLLRLASNWSGKVVITGTVPDVRPFLRQASVAVAPLVYGVGCQNKVLEAMACETPVVATGRAVAALTASPGRDVIVAEGPLAFADAVLGLLENPARQREVGSAGRAYVESNHRWDRVAARLETVYMEVMAARGGQRLERVAG
jgi:glycosyltransferase involved in cell wall biosynthesis